MKIVKKFNYLFLVIVLQGCSEPFNFETEGTSIDVVDGKVSTKIGRSYVDIYRMEGDERVEIKDLDVNIVSSAGDIYQFGFNEVANRHEPIDENFKGEVGVKYRVEASDSDKLMYESTYDSIPDLVDFKILIKDTTGLEFIVSTSVLLERRGTAAIAQIPSSNGKFYARLKFRYQYEDYFIPGDSLGKSDPTEYKLYNSYNAENNDDHINVPAGVRLIYKYFIFVASGCNGYPVGAYSSDVIPLSCGCCHLEEFWPVTFEVSIESMSEPTYKYWENAQKLAKNDGLIFDSYPFPIESNISCNNCENRVTGSFRAVSETIRKKDWGE